MKSHWEKIYSEKDAEAVSWFQPRAEMSLKLIANAGIQETDPVIDIGGGAARLVDGLLEAGYSDVTVLDISGAALAVAKNRLGPRAAAVKWIEADITGAALPGKYALWHDRAVFHFLKNPDDRRKYAEAARSFLLPRGHLVISAFAPDGPEKCSGLEIVRHSPESLQAELGGGFELAETQHEAHRTPFGTEQKFVYCRFRLTANFC
jgi:SAM-dependent methyltransferase